MKLLLMVSLLLGMRNFGLASCNMKIWWRWLLDSSSISFNFSTSCRVKSEQSQNCLFFFSDENSYKFEMFSDFHLSFSDLLLVILVGVVSAWTSTFEELHKLKSFWTCAGDTTNVAAWEVVLQGSMLRGAWKSLPCSLLPMKVSITTPGFHHSQRLHELHGELQQGQAPLFNFLELFVRLAPNALSPVHILHLSTMDVYLEQFFFFWFWRVSS